VDSLQLPSSELNILCDLAPSCHEHAQGDEHGAGPDHRAEEAGAELAAKKDVDVVVHQTGGDVAPSHSVQRLRLKAGLVGGDDGGGKEAQRLIAIFGRRLYAEEELLALRMEGETES
jgi:hypothetical protein